MRNNWYVITGGPSVGKTTTIELLKKRGYNTTHETARYFFETEMSKGRSNEDIRRDPQALQHSIFRLQKELESHLDPQQITFLDRAVADSVGYFAYHHLSPLPELKNYDFGQYQKVFFLDPVQVVVDEVRTETEEEVRRIGESLLAGYQTTGLEIVRVPVMAKNERVDFILSHVKPTS